MLASLYEERNVLCKKLECLDTTPLAMRSHGETFAWDDAPASSDAPHGVTARCAMQASADEPSLHTASWDLKLCGCWTTDELARATESLVGVMLEADVRAPTHARM